MSKRILLFQTYWTDGKVPSTRTLNAHYTMSKNKGLVNFLRSQGVDIDYKFYDYSPDKMFRDAIHIPYELGAYKRAEKINRIVFGNSEYDYMLSLDSDVFFDVKDYVNVKDLLLGIPDNVIALFDAANLTEETTHKALRNENVNLFDDDYIFAFSGQNRYGKPLEGSEGGLGGSCLFYTKFFTGVGGYDEEYTSWGGEDINLMRRIRDKYSNDINMVRCDFWSFHLHHDRDLYSEAYIQPWIREEWFKRYPDRR